ncbi:hypothetical protein [Peribacillus saganii]|uniref:hypothetical protein n=1 Tax=Peribacillus saganii TaxID=2303992 RepID=UPI001314204C|nr:hypothetical protein [Peribacillus saganii]
MREEEFFSHMGIIGPLLGKEMRSLGKTGINFRSEPLFSYNGGERAKRMCY